MTQKNYRAERAAVLAQLDEARRLQARALGLQRAAFGVAVEAARETLAALRAMRYRGADASVLRAAQARALADMAQVVKAAA
jgi:hypothetical protein